MQTYEPGDVYFSTFPKFVQIAGTTDYNLDSLKPNPSPRPIVVLQQLSDRRIIVAPISSDGIQNHLLFPSYVPISHKQHPDFLKNDSFIKTNQIQAIDVKWLHPSGAPRKAGQLQGLELDRVYQFALFVTQNEVSYARWISEIVTKNVKADPKKVERDVLDAMNLPNRNTRTPHVAYDRGEVFDCHFPEVIKPATTDRVTGIQKAVVLTDAKYAHLPAGQTIVVPLIENTAENMRFASTHDVGFRIDGKDYRAAISQIQPMNRDWMDRLVARLAVGQQIELDRAVIAGLGIKQEVLRQSRSIIREHLRNKPRSR